MRILIDECVPKRLVSSFLSHNCITVPQAGWSGKKNGELLRLMVEAKFDVFITVDQNLQYQQNLVQTALSIIVLKAKSSNYQDLLPYARRA